MRWARGGGGRWYLVGRTGAVLFRLATIAIRAEYWVRRRHSRRLSLWWANHPLGFPR